MFCIASSWVSSESSQVSTGALAGLDFHQGMLSHRSKQGVPACSSSSDLGFSCSGVLGWKLFFGPSLVEASGTHGNDSVYSGLGTVSSQASVVVSINSLETVVWQSGPSGSGVSFNPPCPALVDGVGPSFSGSAIAAFSSGGSDNGCQFFRVGG